MIQKSFLEKIKLYEWLVEKSHSSNDLNKKGIYALCWIILVSASK